MNVEIMNVTLTTKYQVQLFHHRIREPHRPIDNLGYSKVVKGLAGVRIVR